jgi:hypothetical protein
VDAVATGKTATADLLEKKMTVEGKEVATLVTSEDGNEMLHQGARNEAGRRPQRWIEMSTEPARNEQDSIPTIIRREEVAVEVVEEETRHHFLDERDAKAQSSRLLGPEHDEAEGSSRNESTIVISKINLQR